MRRDIALLPVLLLVTLLFAPLTDIHAQSASASDPLFSNGPVVRQPTFDAYNHCDLEKFGSLLAVDLEFYHDPGGFSRSRQTTVDGVKNNVCGKVTRELVPGTLEVYPIANYGAVEIGVHRFHHPGQESVKSVGDEVHSPLAKLKDGAWKLTRVIRFDHHPLTK